MNNYEFCMQLARDHRIAIAVTNRGSFATAFIVPEGCAGLLYHKGKFGRSPWRRPHVALGIRLRSASAESLAPLEVCVAQIFDAHGLRQGLLHNLPCDRASRASLLAR